MQENNDETTRSNENDDSSLGAELLCELKNSRREKNLLQSGSPASFVQGLVSMLKYEDTNMIDLVNGELLICSQDVLENSQILSKYYKHNNAKSFQRQLYNFGWQKKIENDDGMAAFTHPALACASKDSGLEVILKLKRKSNPTSSLEPIQFNHSSTSSFPPAPDEFSPTSVTAYFDNNKEEGRRSPSKRRRRFCVRNLSEFDY